MKVSRFLEYIFSVKNKNGKKKVRLFGIQVFTWKRGLWENFKINHDRSLRVGIPDDLTLQMMFNNDCNCKCKFCFAPIAQKKEELQIFSKEWLYEDFLPLYAKTRHLVPTNGEITIRKEAYEFLTFIHKNYPGINVSLETNGIAFDEKWAKLATDNLMRVNFSINAVDEEYYKKTVWDKNGVYPVIMKNYDFFLETLKKNNVFAFKPSVSIVVNDSNHETYLDFIKQHLLRGIQVIVIFFDNCTSEWICGAFKTLLEIDRLIKEKVFLNFKLFVPIDNLPELEKQVAQEDINALSAKYADIVDLVKSLPTLKELYAQRTEIREKYKKKYYSYYEEITGPTYHQKAHKGTMICENPWTHLRVRPNGDTAVCSWYPYFQDQNLKHYMKNGKIDWRAYFNNPRRKRQRYKFLQGCYIDCMHNCPGMAVITQKEFKDIYD